MSTKVSIFKPKSNSDNPKKQLIPIKLEKIIYAEEIRNYSKLASSFDNVILISKKYDKDFDLILAYNEGELNTNSIFAFLGHWNDGVVI